MSDVLDNAVHAPTEELFVFVVHCHDDEEFGAAWGVVVYLAEGEAGVFEVVGVAGCCGVAHVGEFALVAQGTHVEELLGDFVI